MPVDPHSLLPAFRQSLDGPDLVGRLEAGLIGRDAVIDGPFGPRSLVYADHVASGRALRQVESFILDRVLPFYANSHTEASFCGSFVTRLRRAARAAIAGCCHADDSHAVIFAGAGATAGINRLVALLGAGPGVRVILGPYEHHSNILPWRESGAEVIEIGEAQGGGPDLAELGRALAGPGRVICAFSAASNVTGIVTDVAAVTRLAKSAGAAMVWDYAGGGPYLPIDMGTGIDAVVISPHKFIGGPGASGVLILRRDAVVAGRPTWPGGGTVRFVSAATHDYSDRIEVREEAGTPDVLGDIRAALAFLVKDALGAQGPRNAALTRRAFAAWAGHPRIEILAADHADRLPILSFRIRDGRGGFVHHQLVTRMLSDCYGIQARGGCACAGPYVHRLLGIGADDSRRLRAAILSGDELHKPGFVRLNLSLLLPAAKVDFILNSVARLADEAAALADHYTADPACAIFAPRGGQGASFAAS